MSQPTKPASPLPEDLPLTMAALGTRAPRFAEALRAMAGHVAAGQVPNARYDDLRFSVLDKAVWAWQSGPPAALMDIGAANRTLDPALSREAIEASMRIDLNSSDGLPGVRKLPSRVEALLARDNRPEITAALVGVPARLAEIVLVAEAMGWLRERRVKRNAPGSAPPKPEMPRATREAQELVRDRMREISGDLRERFAAWVAATVSRRAVEFERACAETAAALTTLREQARAANADGRHVGVSDTNGLRMLRARVDQLRIEAEPLVHHDYRTYATTRHPDGAARLDKFAREETERMFGLWTARNVAKLAPVIEARGGAVIKATRAEVVANGVETAMDLAFPDGSGFTYTNGVEYAYSPLGKEFARFPARFHEVVLADGTRMRGPSEAKVKEAFGVAPEEAPPAPSR